MADRWLTDEEQVTWRAFLALEHHVGRAIDRQLAEAGVSTADFQLLVPLSEAEGGEVRSCDLAAIVGWERSRLSHQIKRMEARDLITRHEVAGDARGTLIRITDSGRATIERVAPGHVATVRRHFVDKLEPGDHDVLRRLSEKVTADTGC